MLAPEHWWNCMPAPERGAILGIYGLIVPPVFVAPCVVVDAILLFMAVGESRRQTFRAMFGLVSVEGIPLPPPLDCETVFDPAIWQPIYEYLRDIGPAYVPCDCENLRQPGTQGGSWPDCWP